MSDELEDDYEDKLTTIAHQAMHELRRRGLHPADTMALAGLLMFEYLSAAIRSTHGSAADFERLLQAVEEAHRGLLESLEDVRSEASQRAREELTDA